MCNLTRLILISPKIQKRYSKTSDLLCSHPPKSNFIFACCAILTFIHYVPTQDIIIFAKEKMKSLNYSTAECHLTQELQENFPWNINPDLKIYFIKVAIFC